MSSRGGQQPGQLHVIRQLSGRLSRSDASRPWCHRVSSRGGQQPGQLHVVRQLSGRLSGVVPQRHVQAVVSPSVITWRPAARPPPRCPSAVRPSVPQRRVQAMVSLSVTECHRVSSHGGQRPGQLHVVRQLSGRLSGVVPQRRVQAVVSPSVITWRPAARPPPRCPSAVRPSVRPSVRRGPAATRPGRRVTECHDVAASSPASSTLSVSCPAVCPAWSRSDASRPWCHRVSPSVITWRPAARPAPRCPSAVRPSVRRGLAATRPGHGVTECH